MPYSAREKDKRTDMLKIYVAFSDCYALASINKRTPCDLYSKLLIISIVNKVVTQNQSVVTNKNITRDRNIVILTKRRVNSNQRRTFNTVKTKIELNSILKFITYFTENTIFLCYKENICKCCRRKYLAFILRIIRQP